MTATKGPNIFDVSDAGQGGQFSLLRVGGTLYAAIIAKGGNGGRLFVGKPFQLEPIDLGPLGITGALHVNLDRGDNGNLQAYISRIIDTDGQDKGRRVITTVDTGIAIGGGGDTPVTPPAPPGGAVDLSQLVAAIDAARGPADGKDAPDNSIAGVKNTGNAIYDRLGIKAGDKTVGERLDRIDATFDADDVVDRLLFRPPTRDYGLPPDMAQFIGSDLGQFLAAWCTTYLENVLRRDEFPRADGGTILRT